MYMSAHHSCPSRPSPGLHFTYLGHGPLVYLDNLNCPSKAIPIIGRQSQARLALEIVEISQNAAPREPPLVRLQLAPKFGLCTARVA